MPISLIGLIEFTQLVRLEISIPKSLPLDYLYSLTSLESLELSAVDGSIDVISGLTKLSALSRLVFGRAGETLGDAQVHVMLCMEWQRMYALKCLMLREVEFTVDAGILGLTQLVHLQNVTFCGSIKPSDVTSTRYFADFFYFNSLAVNCPHVTVRIG